MKMIKALGIFTLSIVVFSCTVKEKVPGNILSQEKMRVVLKDMMTADQFLANFVLNKDTTKKKETESIRLYNQVFAIHEISPETFFKSFTFYKEHPGLLQPILDSLRSESELKAIKIID